MKASKRKLKIAQRKTEPKPKRVRKVAIFNKVNPSGRSWRTWNYFPDKIILDVLGDYQIPADLVMDAKSAHSGE